MKRKAIVTGMIATYPVAGVLWDYVQYAIALERLGLEVFYLEDSGLDSYHESPAAYLENSLGRFSPELKKRWHYRTTDGRTYGLNAEQWAAVVRDAALFLNVSGGCLMRDEYLAAKRRVLIDTDPGLNHFVNYPKWDAAPGWEGTHGYRAHDYFFTYAENLGRPTCVLPDLGLPWHATRPPVVLELWRSAAPEHGWTTVMSWKPYQHYKAGITHQGATYGAKEIEFEKFATLPQRVAPPLEVAIGGENPPVAAWRASGWKVTDAAAVSAAPGAYRDYIQSSRGEFSVAKNIYVGTRSGWFSCRSVCYLAAGLPVVVQDTGFSENIPTGEGLLAFTKLDEAVLGIEAVERDYAAHQRAARRLAETEFASEIVLGALLEKIGA